MGEGEGAARPETKADRQTDGSIEKASEWRRRKGAGEISQQSKQSKA